MCGIAGYLGSKPLPRERLDACFARMKRRGPDATGEYHGQTSAGLHLHLLHSRLSIIDLNERSNQPFRHDNSLLVCNGELYNYLEIRNDLSKRGEQFETTSDTEVLLRKLQKDGVKGLEECEGMWAFAMYDETSGKLVLSRDRFGEKPLYIYRIGTDIYFGSEIKFVIALAGTQPPVNTDQLYRYLVNGYKSLYKQGRTFYRNVDEVRPGTAVILNASGHESIYRYWNLQFNAQIEEMTYDQAVAQTRSALIKSVELRLRADVPLAFCLSGGIDSNALIGIAKREFDYDVHGFTIMNTDERYEEKDMVNLSVSELGIRHTPVPLRTDGFIEGLTELIAQHDAPVYTITYYVQWLLMREIKNEGYRVSFSGTGADELFSGYFDHHNAYLYEVRNDKDRYASALKEWNESIAPIVRNSYLQDPELFMKDPGERRHIYLDNDIFAGFLNQPWFETFGEMRYTGGVLRNRMLNELFHESVPLILHEDDLNAMYFSIENRSPFLDSNLFETAMQIPTRHLIRNGRAKAVLRDAVRGLVPDPVLDNPRKVGFNAPILDLLDIRDAKVRDWILDDGPVYEHVRRDKIQTMLDRDHLKNSESKFLFYFLCAKIFLEQACA